MSEVFAKGCLPPSADVRDYTLARSAASSKLPTAYTTQFTPRVKNQGGVNSCVAHATSSILEYHETNDGGDVKLSTNFIYGIQKQISGYAGQGMYFRDACKIANKYGDMLESDCPGNDEVPAAHSIAEEAVKDSHKIEVASYYKISSYVRLTNNNNIKYAIMNYGPVLASVKWYNTFKCDKDGVLQGEQKGDAGHHAIMLYGWNETGFLAQNSWGTNWGKKGRFILPYEIPVAEAWQFIDAENNDVVKPKRTPFLDIVYKIVNIFVNLFIKIFKQ